jgi:RimJ/RimL family protein N-acetyltransferase
VAVAEGVAILVLLSVAGLGWTRVLFGPGVPPEVVVGVTPAMGCAVLMLGALAAVETGVRLQGAGGVLTFVVVAGLGAVLAWVRPPRLESQPRLRAEPIETDRFVLRPLRIEDADEMAAVLADPALHRFTGGRPADADELRVRFANVARERSPDGREAWLNWIVRLRGDGAAVGTVQATVDDREATLAWIVGVPWQGRGVASEAAEALVAWLRARGVDAMAAHIHPDHEASAAVARRVGLHPTDEVVGGEVVWRSDRP